MIDNLKIIRAEGVYPYRNQAIEKYLLDTCKAGELILYLWANDKTVFIGKNQNAYKECNISSLVSDGGYLARRFTGGGAVYHDGGNLNFTFITCRKDYDIPNQFAVILNAMRALGFNAEVNGRNDITIDGKKFSGNAFYKSRTVCLHHGTILINSAFESIAKYLNASKVKLEAKGVESVKSRVCNLCEYKRVSAEEVVGAMQEALFNKFPNAKRQFLKEEDLPEDILQELTRKFADKSYILGDDIHYSVEFEYRFKWGVADIRLQFNGDIIEKAKIYSDALDTAGIALKERLLTGLDLTKPVDPRIKDIIDTLKAENK